MRLTLTNNDWDNIVDLILTNVRENNDYNGVIYYSDLEVEVAYIITEDGYREQETNGYIQTLLDVELKEPYLTHDRFITELDWSYDDLKNAEREIYKTLTHR